MLTTQRLGLSMRLISKSTESNVPLSEHSITQGDLTALKGDQWSNNSQKTLKRLHGKCWLQCDCSSVENNAPTLTIRANPNKTYSLVNISGRGEHIKNCPLSYERLINHLREKSNTPLNISDASNQHSLALLATLIIDNSKLNSLSDTATYNNNKERVISSGSKNITVQGTSFDSLFNFGFRSFFSVRDKPNIEGDFIMEVVDEIQDIKGKVALKDKANGNTLFSFYRNITDVHIVEDPNPSKDGAYLVLAYIGKNPKNREQNKITPICAYILPLVSKVHWSFPNHIHSRKMYHSLIKAQIWYKKHKDISISICAPVRPLVTTNGHCLPDFILSTAANMHLVNLLSDQKTMIMNNHLKNINFLQELAPVTEIDFSGVTDINNHIFEIIKSIIKKLCD
ncbi:MAG: hypothetical protein ACI87J_002105 [Colwellia sp.]|jgi:hypothetical protein